MFQYSLPLQSHHPHRRRRRHVVHNMMDDSSQHAAADDDTVPEEWNELLERGIKAIGISISITHHNSSKIQSCWNFRINWKDGHGQTMLICAVAQLRLEIAKELIRHGANVNSGKDKVHGFTALMHAVRYLE